MLQNDDLEVFYKILAFLFLGIIFKFVLKAFLENDKKEFNESLNQNTDLKVPKDYVLEIPIEVSDKINQVNWKDFKTAYGNAENTIPLYLRNLFSTNYEIAFEATHNLWCSLCHQHAFISSASLPSYDILKFGVINLNDELKIEILDIFKGFSYCTSKDYYSEITTPIPTWEKLLKEELISDIVIFKELAFHNDELISSFAKDIIADLTDEELK